MVLPEEAEVLVLAQELGGLSMALRNEDDLDALDSREKGTTIATLMSGKRMELLHAQRAHLFSIIRGGQETRTAVP